MGTRDDEESERGGDGNEECGSHIFRWFCGGVSKTSIADALLGGARLFGLVFRLSGAEVHERGGVDERRGKDDD